jgi:uncharacterized lipoprotein NlpE involved in copper resistance
MLVKNVFRALVAAMLMLSLSAFAQADKQAKKTEKAQQKEAKTAAKGKTASLTGWIKTEGDKTVFTNDKDKQDWTVKNADAAKAHDGKHVKVTARLNEGDQSIEIQKISDMREGKQSKQTQDADKK